MRFLRIFLGVLAGVALFCMGFVGGHVVGAYTERHLVSDMCKAYRGFQFQDHKFVCFEFVPPEGKT